MNATGTSTATNAELARDFTARVRASLEDLPADELDDLLDGLGADLEERLADDGDLGDPARYADELRQAAGLPPREEKPETRRRRSLAEEIGSMRSTIAAWFDATPARGGFRDFLLSLRPVWWIIRAVVLVWVALRVFGHPVVNGLPISFPAVALTILSIIVSVQWGRGRWLPRTWLRHIRTGANIAAVLLVVPVTAILANALVSPTYIYDESDPGYWPGLYTNGDQVTNIFAYDCAGELLDGIRLYDQNGTPLTTALVDGYAGAEQMAADQWDEQTGEQLVMGFNPLAAESAEWNVYPLTASEYSEFTGEPRAPEVVTPPRETIAPLVQECPVPDTEDTGAEADAKADVETGTDSAKTEE